MELPFSLISVQEKLLAFPIPLLTVFGSASFDAFLWIILLKRIFRVVVYYLVIKVLRVSLFSTAILDYHIFKRLSTAFLFFSAVRFRSFVSAALTCDSCVRISCCKLNVNAFFQLFSYFFHHCLQRCMGDILAYALKASIFRRFSAIRRSHMVWSSALSPV